MGNRPRFQRVRHVQQVQMESCRSNPAVFRMAYSEDGIFAGDGKYRWWQEYDSSGYNWNGAFDIIEKQELDIRIEMCHKLSIPVFEKFEDDSYEAR